MSTTTVIKSDVANPALASEGKKKIEWAARNMPVLAQIKDRFAKEKGLLQKIDRKTDYFDYTFWIRGNDELKLNIKQNKKWKQKPLSSVSLGLFACTPHSAMVSGAHYNARTAAMICTPR